jgi:hypothetical protein
MWGWLVLFVFRLMNQSVRAQDSSFTANPDSPFYRETFDRLAAPPGKVRTARRPLRPARSSACWAGAGSAAEPVRDHHKGRVQGSQVRRRPSPPAAEARSLAVAGRSVARRWGARSSSLSAHLATLGDDEFVVRCSRRRHCAPATPQPAAAAATSRAVLRAAGAAAPGAAACVRHRERAAL